ncbi:MAG: DUF5652 family protein [Patescibacteria group bacterium]
MQLFDSFLSAHPYVLLLVIVWTLPWKGYALWKSAQKNDTWWFIGLLIVNTLGVLDILYIFIFSKRVIEKKTSENQA